VDITDPMGRHHSVEKRAPDGPSFSLGEGSEMDNQEQRIEELEAEVAALRAKVAAGEAPGTHDPELIRTAGWGKKIALAAGIVLICAGLMVAIFAVLSKGFESLARKAARSYSVGFEGDAEAPDNSAPPPAVPGL